MIVIFPFEAKVYEDAGVPVTFVGHPLVDLVTRGARPRPASSPRTGSTPRARWSPCSRAAGARRSPTTCRPLAGAVRLLARRRPDLQFLAAVGPSIDPAALRARAARRGRPRAGAHACRALHRERRRRRLRHGHRRGRAARHADGGRVPPVPAHVPPRAAVRAGAARRHGQPDRGRRHRPGADPGRVHAGDGGGRRCCRSSGPRREPCARPWPRCGGGWGPPGASGRAAEVVAGILAGQKSVDSRDLP